MKSKNSRLALGIVALILFLGVGYAVVSGTTLTLTGTASTANTTLNVTYVENSFAEIGKASNSNATVTNASGSPTDTVATFTVENLSFKGDYVEFSYNIINNEKDVDANVVVTNTTGETDYFEITTSIDETAQTLTKAGGTYTMTVRVTLADMPIEEEDSSTTFTVTIGATAAAAS